MLLKVGAALENIVILDVELIIVQECGLNAKRAGNVDSPSLDRRLRAAEREYLEFPRWETRDKYNRLLRRAGRPETPIPTEEGTINALPGFYLTGILGPRIDLRRNPEPDLCECINCHRNFPSEDGFE